MGLLDNFSTLSDSAKQYALNALARFGNGVGNTVQQIPGNAQRLAQGLLTLPQTVHNDITGLLSPQVNQRVNQAMNNPQPADPNQWMNQGMALAGMAPVTAPIGMFIGQGAKTWDAIAAQKANEMLNAGHDPRQVWQQTGTMRGVDGALRQEIPDNGFTLAPNYKSSGSTYTASGRLLPGFQTVKDSYGKQAEEVVKLNPNMFKSVDDLIPVASGVGASHDNLVSAYPDLINIESQLSFLPKSPGAYGGDYKAAIPDLGMSERIRMAADNPESIKSGVLHELQHAIQQREGWARGGSPEDFMPEQSVNDARVVAARIARGETPSQAAQWLKDNLGRSADPQLMDLAMSDPQSLFSYPANPMLGYKRLAGEAEARMTQARMNLDAAQRLQHYPYDPGPYGLDVPQNQLIVRGLIGQ